MADEETSGSKKVNLEVDLDKWVPTNETTLLQIIAGLLAIQIIVLVFV